MLNPIKEGPWFATSVTRGSNEKLPIIFQSCNSSFNLKGYSVSK